MGTYKYTFPRSQTIRVGDKIVACNRFAYKESFWNDAFMRLARARVNRTIDAWDYANERPDYFVYCESLKELRKAIQEHGSVPVYATAGRVSYLDTEDHKNGFGEKRGILTKQGNRWALR